MKCTFEVHSSVSFDHQPSQNTEPLHCLLHCPPILTQAMGLIAVGQMGLDWSAFRVSGLRLFFLGLGKLV